MRQHRSDQTKKVPDTSIPSGPDFILGDNLNWGENRKTRIVHGDVNLLALIFKNFDHLVIRGAVHIQLKSLFSIAFYLCTELGRA